MSISAKSFVGVYYYPWYRGDGGSRWFEKNRWRRAMRLHLKNPQKPKSGLYNSRDPKVIADHIEQSIRGGISFWAVSWWGPGEDTDETFRENILKHPDSSKLKYAILYESTSRMRSFKKPNYSKWVGDLEYLKKNYFDDPRYLKINGRPVIFVYLSREYFRNKGQNALKQMREKFPEIYLVGDDVYFGDGSEEDYKSEWAKNFDAVTAYDVYGQSIGKFGCTQKAIKFLAKNYQQAKKAANSVGTAFMPAIAPGYNDTAVRRGHPGRARYFTDVENSKEGDIFREMIRQVALPNLDPLCNNIIMVTSFNEWYEDSQIEATAGTSPASTTDDSKTGNYYTGGQKYNDYGYLYLDILKEEIPKSK
ncbi:MAG: glycoside hydrolase family 99-like domain-containing protein [Deltaproteobacteria bacterium]|nr:glycoside hydrolase family 99-like domain-containing protein [Deltaproteobacteria bacterium]